MDIVFRPRREANRFIKRGRPSDIKIGILMLLPYNAAISSLFLQISYEYLNSIDGVLAYRYVYNTYEDVVEALDSNIPLSKLDALLISLPYEIDYIYAARVLLGLKLSKRFKGDNKPIVIVGGAAPTANPLPLADIVDAVFIGEVEDVFMELVYAVGDENPIKSLESIKCVSLSPFNERVRRCIVSDLDRAFHPIYQVYPIDEEPIYGHGMRIELSRGCPYLCPFCLEGHIFYPFRYRSMEKVLSIINRGLDTYKLRRIVLYSLSLFSIPYIDRFFEKMLERGIEVSVPSIRIEHLNESRIEMLRKLGQKTLTIAPEILIDKYSCYIGKCFGEERLHEIVVNAYRNGFEHLKLYLITGFPFTDIDMEIKELEKFLENIRGIVKKEKFIRISLNPLIPKPWTPYQYIPPARVLSLEENMKRYREVVKRYSRIVELEIFDVEWAFIQAIIALGHRGVSKLIEKWAQSRIDIGLLMRTINEVDMDKNYIFQGWEEPPWHSVVDIGIPTNYLENRYRFLSLLKS
ncbi:Radical SAM domain protein [Ignisphaera aggregans DSM 17230]|uniref:Radical SAM domain protein n=1 Tax=Ignisphaera aggregans (strain DSM 17230 / JCM 13409 / AQ1.S1) TaxID=583356 RepID=E0SRM0_IGNAA|nr:Radical SAM domain protein [Ignisphaera aggregans DSM 17230]